MSDICWRSLISDIIDRVCFTTITEESVGGLLMVLDLQLLQ